ncbi:MAG: 50S ribosome-binding GTPase [Bacteriovoracaceae bacterium]|nr:50S ribosome-binding GTPase [Bacteriovoracaceae bacterium]
MKRSAVVSIIGRPNVGKSTIFNRLMRQAKLAMTHDQPGVTRDRHYGILNLMEGAGDEREVIMVDTGGFYPQKIEVDPKKKNNIDPFFNLMADHARLAIEESDLVLFVVDAREGLNPFDQGIRDFIRIQQKPVWILVNKFDTDKQMGDEVDFYQLDIDSENLLLISAEHNRGIGDLRERLWRFAADFAKVDAEEAELLQRGVKPAHDVVASVAIIGAPNAGKSTLLNGLVGAQRALVSEIAGTTVDPIEGYIDLFFGEDTAFLKSQENQFRKESKDLYEEMKAWASKGAIIDIEGEQDEVDERIYVEYGQMAPELGLIPDKAEDSNDGFEAEEAIADFDMSEYFSDEAIETALVEGVESSVDVELEEAKRGTTDGFRSIKLVDTAGIRRSKKVEGFIEEQSVYRSLRAITESDVVLFMVDSTLGITHQDRRLLDIALEKGKSLIICLNKIDLLRETFANQKKKKEWLEDLKYKIPWLGFCQLVTISARQNRNLGFLKGAIRHTIEVRHKKISTGQLNKTLQTLVDRHPVVVNKTGGVKFRVKYASMIKSAPPTFLLFTNKSQGIPENYRKYLVNGLRQDFNLLNTPVHLIFRTSSDLERRMKKIQAKTKKN